VYVLLVTRNPIAIGLLFTTTILFAKCKNGYFNPAITIALSMIGIIEKADVLPYRLSQILGGITGIYFYNHTQL
jgi:glycerol uptake facilitator-like aquaporin